MRHLEISIAIIEIMCCYRNQRWMWTFEYILIHKGSECISIKWLIGLDRRIKKHTFQYEMKKKKINHPTIEWYWMKENNSSWLYCVFCSGRESLWLHESWLCKRQLVKKSTSLGSYNLFRSMEIQVSSCWIRICWLWSRSIFVSETVNSEWRALFCYFFWPFLCVA